METKSLIAAIAASLFLASTTTAQPIVQQRKGNFRAQGNIAGAYLFQQKIFMPYLTGDMDLFFDNHVALAGSVWVSLPISKIKSGLKQNHAVFGGINYHPLKKGRWDPYICLTPGIGLVQAEETNGELVTRTHLSPVPLLSASVGCNYYIGSIFNFFVKAQGVSGQFFKLEHRAIRLDDLRLTAGLGFNFQLWKPKNII
jgi:hypothetical protein